LIAQYKYPFGRRIEKNINGVITNYVYDNNAILLEYDNAGNVIRSYTNGDRIDEPLMLNSSGAAYFYHVDGLGSVEGLSDSTGTLVQKNVYDVYGALIQKNVIGTAPAQPYAFTGRELDDETGLYYYRARYYDPQTGRFMSKDPLGFAGGDVNLYRMTGNNPVNYTDPLGLESEVGVRPFYPRSIPYARHCFIRFNKNNSDTVSFSNQGINPDPNPGGASYSRTKGKQNDACVRQEMNKCKGSDYDFAEYNCCQCASTALNACGLSKEGPWPNAPYHAGNPPYTPKPFNPNGYSNVPGQD
jgi:RHS repeat-associated protein